MSSRLRQQGGHVDVSEDSSTPLSDSSDTMGCSGMQSYKRVGGDVVVYTPWFPEGIPKSNIRLSDEIHAFASFLALTPQQQATRTMLRGTLQEVVQQLWPDATVKCYGSYAYGLSTAGSAVDLVCEGCGDVSMLETTGMDILTSKRVEVVYLQCTAYESFLRVAMGGVTANVSFVSGKSIARQTVALVKKWLSTFPAAGPVSLVIRVVLGQVKCQDPTSGGLSSYTILVMVLFICHHIDDPLDAGKVLAEFFQYYGNTFDFSKHAITCEGLAIDKGPLATAEVVVCDPFDPTNNLAVTCTRLAVIRSQFQYCTMALAKWDDGLTRRKGYKGRTPLSTFISHQPYISETRKTQSRIPPLPPPSTTVFE